ncbi:hypothetical protein Tco_1138323 [Tanacetum coccineum]
MVLNSPCFMVKSWLVQDQTVLGKDYSNLLIADSLLKTIWFINAPCYDNESLTSPKANGFGKDKSNSLIVGSLLKTTRSRSRFDRMFGYILQELKKINLKKHEVKQVQQSCLGEDCWEIYIPDLVPLETPKKEDTAKVPAKVDVTEQGTKKRKGGHMKMIARKRKRPQPDVDSNDEHRECLKIVTFECTIDSDIMEKKSSIARINKVSSPDGDYLVIYKANGNFKEFNCLLEVLHIFDRQDLFHLYDLVIEQYSEITLEGIELILWEDLKIMMESLTEENDQRKDNKDKNEQNQSKPTKKRRRQDKSEE